MLHTYGLSHLRCLSPSTSQAMQHHASSSCEAHMQLMGSSPTSGMCAMLADVQQESSLLCAQSVEILQSLSCAELAPGREHMRRAMPYLAFEHLCCQNMPHEMLSASSVSSSTALTQMGSVYVLRHLDAQCQIIDLYIRVTRAACISRIIVITDAIAACLCHLPAHSCYMLTTVSTGQAASAVRQLHTGKQSASGAEGRDRCHLATTTLCYVSRGHGT